MSQAAPHGWPDHVDPLPGHTLMCRAGSCACRITPDSFAQPASPSTVDRSWLESEAVVP